MSGSVTHILNLLFDRIYRVNRFQYLQNLEKKIYSDYIFLLF